MPTVKQAQQWYSNDPVHGWDHIARVTRLARQLAEREGADMEIVQAAALLHDADPSFAQNGDADSGLHTQAEGRAAHQHTSAEFAAEILQAEGWPPERIEAVAHCIRAHRFRNPSETPQTLEAKVLFDADKLDAIGAVGVARAIAYSARAGQPAYARPSARFVQEGKLEAGEASSAYHEYVFKLRKLKARLFTASGKALAEARHARMTQYFEDLAQESGAADLEGQ